MRSSLCESCCASCTNRSEAFSSGIGLGDADDAADGRAEALLLAVRAPRALRCRRTARLTRSLHQRALVVRVQRHRVVERGHEVGPPSQLGVDVAPGGVRPVARAGQPVVQQHGASTTTSATIATPPRSARSEATSAVRADRRARLPLSARGIEALDQLRRGAWARAPRADRRCAPASPTTAAGSGAVRAQLRKPDGAVALRQALAVVGRASAGRARSPAPGRARAGS